ncbi:hypothetical protein PNEG_01123 [Pneumocystis murina B123]|uniref:3-dehydrosphinganine reductase n=1 Tax=Pneumocystis murina (strain B123) TaxID=1069680 RepID=M7NNY0_PNEMU|nr:hypothetical protein PNEG_01123 [Pneumocystis murina B123]EMR10408.1 hypothetical protein PNEG_01123 [Pneumocystis murina B123]
MPLEGRYVYITGGSQGVGKALAILCTRKGAHVSIVARNENILKETLKEMENVRCNLNQKLKAISADLTIATEAKRALDEASETSPDIVFCCVGAAQPGFFVDLSSEQIEEGIKVNYLTAAYTAHVVLRKMIDNPLSSKASPRRIIFCSSLLAFLGMAGYSQYSPSKSALRCLTDTLRQECLLYGVKVHCAFLATVYTPGFEKEQLIKPELTKELEGIDQGQSPEIVASRIIKNLEKGKFFITTEIIGTLLKNNMRGPSPRDSMITDTIFGYIASFIYPFVRISHDHIVRKYAKKFCHKKIN